MSAKKHVMVRYTLADSVDVDAVKSEIQTFVEGFASHGAGIRYTSFQLQETPRSFAHVGFFPDQQALAEVQAKQFFGQFSAFLRERCAEGPTVSWLDRVASTEVTF